MKTKTIRKIVAVLLIAVFSCCLPQAAVKPFALGEKTPDEIVFYMRKGASVRLEEGESGLRFTALMDKADYAALEACAAETEYGMLICPYSYVERFGELNEENVFGKNAVYTFEDGVAGKTQIICVTSSDMTEFSANKMCFNGAIVNLYRENYDREFCGAAYVALTDGNGATTYKFAKADDNRRSATYVAQRALDAGNFTAEEQALLKEYVDQCLNRTSEYTVNYYLEGDGVYDLAETNTLTGALGETVAAENKVFDGYIRNDKLGCVSSPVYANGRTVLNCYYVKTGDVYDARFDIDLSAAENILDTSSLYGITESINGIAVTEENGKVALSAAETLNIIGSAAGETWTVKTSERSYSVEARIFDKVIYDFADLSAVDENPDGKYLLGGDVYAESTSFAFQKEFNGVFDGGGHCIYNLTVAGKGLFNCIGYNGVVKNLRLKNVSASSAALAYEVLGRIENVAAESGNAQFLVYKSETGAQMAYLLALLGNGKCFVNKSNGAEMNHFVGMIGNGDFSQGDGLTGDGGTVTNGMVSDGSLKMVCEIVAGLDYEWKGLSAGADYVMFFGSYVITL